MLADDPVEATRRFLGKIRGRGRPIDDNERRNILIAAAVAELVHGGSTIDDACEAVEKEAPVGFEMVRKIYLKRRDTLDVRVEVGFHLNEGQEKSNGG